MTPQISVPVLWNKTDVFCNNNLYVIDADSIVAGVVSKPSAPFQPGHPDQVTWVDTLRVQSKTLGTLFVNLTEAAYKILIAAASVPVGKNSSILSFVIGTTGFPAGTTIQDNSLIGATLTFLMINTTPINLSAITFNSTTGTITVPNALNNADTGQVNYYL